MSDARLREFERRWNETGDPDARRAYERERARLGLEKLPRARIVHYIDDHWHGNLGSNGEFLFSEEDARLRSVRIAARCSVHLWPRDLYPPHGSAMRKRVYCTEIEEDVTCKSCLKSLNKPDQRVRHRTHYAPGSKDGRKRGIIPRPVCARNDSAKFTETFSWRLIEVNCPTCMRIMQRGRRRPRRTNVV
ncbi:MAG: hypothetical protein AB7L09_01150 [Nitrospira sp.]